MTDKNDLDVWNFTLTIYVFKKLIKFAGALLPIMQLFWRCSSCRLAREYTNMGTPSKPFPERLRTRMLCITFISAGNWTNLFLLKSSSVKKENKTSLINKLKIKLKRRSRNYHNGDRMDCNNSVIWKTEKAVINFQVGTRKILIKNSRNGGGGLRADRLVDLFLTFP